MKKTKRILSLITSLCMASACFMSANASVSNEQMQYESDVSESIAVENLEYQIVVAVNDNSVLLDNGCALSQSEFQKYSGEDFTLKYGDIINVTYSGIEPIAPGQFVIDENYSIEYIGSASDVYTENLKELTITKKSENNEQLTLRDSDGNSYTWLTHIALITGYGYQGYQAEIAPSLLNVGDVINCVVDSAGKEVILPVSITEDLEICMVVSVGEDEVLLNNYMVISQKTFQKYSGESFNLKCGDVIGLANVCYLETWPMQLGANENSYINYLGSAEEYYSDSMKNLTVTEISDDFSEIVLIDSDEQSYTWYTGIALMDLYGRQYDIEPRSVNVGDVLNCITEPMENLIGKGGVFPVSTVTEPAEPIVTEVTTEDTETTQTTVSTEMTDLTETVATISKETTEIERNYDLALVDEFSEEEIIYSDENVVIFSDGTGETIWWEFCEINYTISGVDKTITPEMLGLSDDYKLELITNLYKNSTDVIVKVETKEELEKLLEDSAKLYEDGVIENAYTSRGYCYGCFLYGGPSYAEFTLKDENAEFDFNSIEGLEDFEVKQSENDPTKYTVSFVDEFEYIKLKEATDIIEANENIEKYEICGFSCLVSHYKGEKIYLIEESETEPSNVQTSVVTSVTTETSVSCVTTSISVVQTECGDNTSVVISENLPLVTSAVETTIPATSDVQPEEELDILMVVCADENTVLLNNYMVISQKTFQKFSGESFNLKCGDVIGLANVYYLESSPMQLGTDENSYIKYLGSAEEYYSDSMKNLTVTEISNDFEEIILTDSVGQSYTWYTRTGFVDRCNVQYDIEPYYVNIGDVFNCITEPIEIFYGNGGVFPVSTVSTVEDVIGDANGDNEVTVRDCAVIASALATGKADKLSSSADFNKDGEVNVRDAAAISRTLAKIK